MADYSHMEGGNVTNGKSRQGPRIQPWDTAYNGFESNGDGWKKLGFASEGHRDHVCRPVIIDTDGRARPAFMVLPPHHHNGDTIVTKTETVAEYVYPTSPASAHTNGFATKQAVKDYTVSNDGLGRPGGPYQVRTPKIKEYIGSDQTSGFATKEGVKDYTISNTGLGRPGGPFQDQTPNPKIKENTSSDQTASRNYPWSRASVTTATQQLNFGGPLRRDESLLDSVKAPTVLNKDGWSRPGRLGWRTPIYQESSVSTPTNDIGSAIDYVRESTRFPSVPMTPPQSRFSASPFTLPTNAGTIDSKEVAARFNGKFM
eukprot:TRINITY_DN5033_c0_g1_i1.p1 TRINITY_DN5033_c0_g1~~TRINITY_DN5033_c0_g1_i1.p1  ORF type:complete len:325 (+),score=34.29 TRINITY_DN5033_c0_g1_i1:33-977(+)